MQTLLRRWLLLPLLVALVAAGCGGGGDDDSSDGDQTAPTVRENEVGDEGDPVMGGTLTIGLEAETNSWLPGESRPANAGYTVLGAIYDPLMIRADDGSVVPYLAESLEPNDDFTVWTLALRDGVKFHDGTDLTAETLKAGFDEYLIAPGSVLSNTFEGTTMEIVDPLTVEYRLEEGNPAFPDNLTLIGGMPFSVEAARAAGADAGARPVGTGPFKFVSWARDSELRVEKNPDYWRQDEGGNQLPYLDAVVFKPIPDEETRLASLQTGDVDAMQTLRQSIVSQLREIADGDDGIETLEWVGNNAGGNIMNVLQPPMDDARIRRATVLGSEQDQIIDVLGGTGISPPQTQYFSEDSPWYSEEVADAYPSHDPEAASALVEEYKNDPERSDGKSPGDPVEIEYYCPPDPSLVEVSQAYQAFWEQVGFSVNLGSVEQAAHIDRALGLSSDPPLAGDFMIQCWRSGGENDPYETFEGAFSEWETNATNVTNFTHPGIDEALETLRTTNDLDERKAAVVDIGLILNEEMPLSWSGSTAHAVGIREPVKGLLSWTSPEGVLGGGVSSSVIRTAMTWIAE